MFTTESRFSNLERPLLSYDLANYYIRQKRYREAEPLLVNALITNERLSVRDPMKFRDCLSSYAKLLRKSKRKGDAEKVETRLRMLVSHQSELSRR